MAARNPHGVLALIVVFLSSGVAAAAPKPATKPAPLPGFVRQIKVVADKAPDCSSLKSIVATVTRGCKTNDEKAIAIYNAARLFYYHRQYPAEKGGIPALKLINVYGWSLCGGQHTVLAALWRQAGFKWRYVGWSRPGHTTVEAFYDGQWHYFDTFLKFYTWKTDPNAPGGRTVANQADIKADPTLVTKQLVLDKGRRVYYHAGNRFEVIGEAANWTAPAFLVCGDAPGGILTGVNSNRVAGSGTGWMGIKFDEDGYTTDVDLGPGFCLTLRWDAIDGAHWWNGRKYVPEHGCGDKDYRNCPAIGPILEPYRSAHPRGARTFASGHLVFQPDLANDAFLTSLAGKDNVKWSKGRLAPADPAKPASITVPLASPYILSRAYGSGDGIDKAEVSTDDGKTFKTVKLADFSDAIGGKYSVLVRLTVAKPVTSLKLDAVVQHNRCALPYLSPGANKITVSVADPKALGRNRLAVTYAYRLGHRYQSYEQLADMGAQLGRAHKAKWSKTPTVVQKVFAAKDLPATFTIPVPTPKDKWPVYPQMLFLRREVLAPGSKPAPLPKGAATARVGAGQALKAMPNPFVMGIAAAPKRVVRPKTTRTIRLAWGHVAAMDGKTFDNHWIKWRPDGKAAWIMLVGGSLGKLPPARRIAAARLVFATTHATPQAPTQVGAVMLKKPFRKGAAYDFKDLGAVIGTTVVPKQAQPGKPVTRKMDITRGLKAVAAGEQAFCGLAIRTIQNRGIDDGWTVRIDVAKDRPIAIELDVYADKAK